MTASRETEIDCVVYTKVKCYGLLTGRLLATLPYLGSRNCSGAAAHYAAIHFPRCCEVVCRPVEVK